MLGGHSTKILRYMIKTKKYFKIARNYKQMNTSRKTEKNLLNWTSPELNPEKSPPSIGKASLLSKRDKTQIKIYLTKNQIGQASLNKR